MNMNMNIQIPRVGASAQHCLPVCHDHFVDSLKIDWTGLLDWTGLDRTSYCMCGSTTSTPSHIQWNHWNGCRTRGESWAGVEITQCGLGGRPVESQAPIRKGFVALSHASAVVNPHTRHSNHSDKATTFHASTAFSWIDPVRVIS